MRLRDEHPMYVLRIKDRPATRFRARCGNCGPSAPATMYQHLRCTNDGNGNPRRVFVFMDATGGIVAVEDEGYRGTPAACRGLVELPSIETYPAERRELLKNYPTLKEIAK